VNLAGDFNTASDAATNANLTVAAAADRVFLGWTSDQAGISTSLATHPIFNLSVLASGLWLRPASHNTYIGWSIKNAPSTAIQSSTSDNVSVLFCDFTDCVSGVQVDNYAAVILCRFDGCTAFVVDLDLESHVLLNEIHNCQATSNNYMSLLGACVALNSFDSNDATGTVGIRFGQNLGTALLNTIDGTEDGISGGDLFSILTALNQFTNNVNGIGGSIDLHASLFDNFFNNSNADIEGTVEQFATIAKTTTDPGYTDFENGDYSTTAAALQRMGLGGLAQSLNVGAWQGTGNGNGNGGGPAGGGGFLFV
jgi:hypothetical protein